MCLISLSQKSNAKAAVQSYEVAPQSYQEQGVLSGLCIIISRLWSLSLKATRSHLIKYVNQVANGRNFIFKDCFLRSPNSI